jgi:hypothetical protein
MFTIVFGCNDLSNFLDHVFLRRFLGRGSLINTYWSLLGRRGGGERGKWGERTVIRRIIRNLEGSRVAGGREGLFTVKEKISQIQPSSSNQVSTLS